MRVLLLAVLVAASAGAQDLAPQLTGRLDSSWVWSQEQEQGTGLVQGWAGLSAGTRDVKSELRLGVTNLPAPEVSLDRAWLKFRFPGLRVTSGLGRLAWGTGYVLVPGDLLFDSTGTDVAFGSDELRSAGAWLGDLWLSLGDEAFAEAAVVETSTGVRVSVAPWGVTFEAAGAWDAARHVAKAAVSVQFPFVLDWYATVRDDWLPDKGGAPEPSLGGGAFGLWSLGELSLSTRHEAFTSSVDWSTRLKTYHELTAAYDGWALTGRALYDAHASTPWTTLVDLRWGPLQNLSVYATSTVTGPWLLKVGATTRW